MESSEFLEWSFQRHLNPISWYIRPIFLIVMCYFAYKRKPWWIVITFIVMMSSMVWFSAPAEINTEMQKVLEFEKRLLSHPLSAIATLSFMLLFIGAILIAFWKRSLRWGLIILNITLVGKVVLSLIFTGQKSGWAPLGNTLFGLVLVNGLATIFYYYRKNRPE